MHKVQPNQKVRILQIEIAVTADVEDCTIRDELSALLSENGIANPESNILDWQYTSQEWKVTASKTPEEGEVFCIKMLSKPKNRLYSMRRTAPEAKMKCTICKQGQTYLGEMVVTLQRGEHTLVFKNVPAQIRENCGEYYLSEDIATRLYQQAEKSIEQGSEIVIGRFALSPT